MPFIVFEGGDGAGKTTQIQRLSAYLEEQRVTAIQTREPGGTPLAEKIREILLAPSTQPPTARSELLLYAACRAQHVERVIEPALQKGSWVLCDRFTASSVAFQADARGLELNAVRWLNNFATTNLSPDLNILLSLHPQQALKRRQNRENQTQQAADRFESEAQSFHEKVHLSYLRQAGESPQNWLVIDASASVDEISSQIIAELRARRWLE